MPNLIRPSTYRCAWCHRVFSFNDHDHAASEAARTCAGLSADEITIVCDACFVVLAAERVGGVSGPVLQ